LSFLGRLYGQNFSSILKLARVQQVLRRASGINESLENVQN
jgi:hypothetical protein